MSYTYLTYEESKDMLQEGDILLFRGTGFISSLIKIAGEGSYSHVAVATKHDEHWECAEYREWFGARVINLDNYIKTSHKSNTQIDVYRVSPYISKLHFDSEKKEVVYNIYDFDGQLITECMRIMSGLPYSYKRIWLLLKIKLFRWKILQDIEKITKELPTNEIVMPVCSTAIAHCFSKNGWPILNKRSDEYIEPSHFALSPRINYLWTFKS